MKILHIYKDYYPVLGGIENHIKLLAEGQARRGHEVTVLVTNTGRDTVIEELDGGRVVKAGRLASISSMKLCQMGPAPRDPETFSMGVLSLFPTHTPVTRSGAYPTVQASR